MGDLFSGKTKTETTGTSDTGPSKFQQPYLDQTFGAAQDIYNSSKGSAAYQGDTYAGMTDEQKKQLASIKDYANGQSMTAANGISAIGAAQTAATNGQAVTNLDRFTQLAGTDATKSNIDAATAYANNPAIDGQIDAASRDVTRNLNESQLPGIDRVASSTGNINSSRAGVAAGIAQRGAGDRIADTSATIRGAAYDKGLSMASSDRAAQLAAYSQAAGQFANLNQQGIDATAQGTSMANTAQDRAAAVDVKNQIDAQGGLDALSRYQAIVGSNAWGTSGTTTGTGTQSTSGNIFGQIAGAAATAASFAAPGTK
jgi:hypothetical protein